MSVLSHIFSLSISGMQECLAKPVPGQEWEAAEQEEAPWLASHAWEQEQRDSTATHYPSTYEELALRSGDRPLLSHHAATL